MAKTLLNGVNEVLTRLDLLDADTGTLASLTDTAKQNWIDLVVQLWNEVIDDLYMHMQQPKPNVLATDTVTLATGTRSYSLASDLLMLRDDFNLYDQTNNHYIFVLGEGGYRKVFVSDPEQDDTGLPSFCAISPINGELYMNRTPTATHNGRQYLYHYDKELVLSAATDTVPFNDRVFRSMVPAVAYLWRRERQRDFDAAIYTKRLQNAAVAVRQLPARDHYGPVRTYADADRGTDTPFAT